MPLLALDDEAFRVLRVVPNATALSLRGAVGGTSTRERRIRVQSQRSGRLQFQASGPPRVPQSKEPAKFLGRAPIPTEIESRAHATERDRVRPAVQTR
jgi:hypothetical protein